MSDGADEESRFRAAIAQSNEAVLKVFWALFWRTDWWIKMKRALPRPTGEAPRGENTDADIYVSLDNEQWARIEVKHRALDFTGPHDYPFRTIFIDRQKSTSRADGYWIVNRRMTHAILIKLSATPEWMVETVSDRGKAGAPYSCWVLSRDDPALAGITFRR